MKRFSKLLMAASLLLCLGSSVRAADVPRSEYPRPQFERERWMNLNGTWSYAFDFGQTGAERDFRNSKGFDGKITVPFCPESSLSGVQYTDFIPCIWYQRSITVPETWLGGKKILLNFGAVDYDATIYIDGKKVGRHCGTGSSFSLDITKFVKAGESANLVVCVKDALRSYKQPGGKQSIGYYSAGCNYTRVTGIWQTVWMEAVCPEGLKRVFATPDIDQQQLVIRPEFYEEGNGCTLTVQVFDGKKLVSSKQAPATNNTVIVLPIKNLKLWWPEEPNLYDVIYTVRDAKGNILDKVTSYAGMRKIHLANGYFYLNNKPY